MALSGFVLVVLVFGFILSLIIATLFVLVEGLNIMPVVFAFLALLFLVALAVLGRGSKPNPQPSSFQ